MLKVYTSRVGYTGPLPLDVTIKSAGEMGRAFAPTSWDMVLGAKSGRIPHDQYRTWYEDVLDKSRKAQPWHWENLLGLPRVVLMCYCTSPLNCHRRYLSEYLMKTFGASYQGEVPVNGSDLPERFPFSNFQPVPVSHEGILYPSVEHYYQAMKTLDLAERRRIAQLPTPGMAKTAGKKLFHRRDWERVKIEVMRDGLKKKFSPGSAYLAALLRTGSDEVVESNRWHDVFWGRCICLQHNGAGENQLGQLLMELRTEARSAGMNA